MQFSHSSLSLSVAIYSFLICHINRQKEFYAKETEVFLHSSFILQVVCCFDFYFIFFFRSLNRTTNFNGKRIEGAKKLIIWLEKTYVVISENIWTVISFRPIAFLFPYICILFPVLQRFNSPIICFNTVLICRF